MEVFANLFNIPVFLLALAPLYLEVFMTCIWIQIEVMAQFGRTTPEAHVCQSSVRAAPQTRHNELEFVMAFFPAAKNLQRRTFRVWMRLKEQLKSSNKPTCLSCRDSHISIERIHQGITLNGPPSKSQRAMTQCVSDAAVWDPYLPSWLHSFWGPRTQQKHKHRPDRFGSHGGLR